MTREQTGVFIPQQSRSWGALPGLQSCTPRPESTVMKQEYSCEVHVHLQGAPLVLHSIKETPGFPPVLSLTLKSESLK